MTHLSRRAFMAASTAAAGLLDNSAAAKAVSPLRAIGLRTAQLMNPLGLEDRSPSFSWQVSAARRGVSQRAYRVRVSSSEERLSAGDADLWDSGKVDSAISTGVFYGGKPLAARQRCFWNVVIWDERGQQSAPSDSAWWEMGLLDASNWTAQWLAAESAEERADREAGMPWFNAPLPANGAPLLLRLPFVTRRPCDAILTIAGSGVLRNVTLDGAPLSAPPHDKNAFGGPPALRFKIRLRAGAHVLAAEQIAKRSFIPARTLSVAGQIRLTYDDSKIERIATGWQSAETPVENWRTSQNAMLKWPYMALLDKQPNAPWPPTPAVLLRKQFSAPATVARARLYVAALGAYEMRLNGQRVSDDLLQSESSDFRKTILYRTYDVAALLKPGENALGAIVGDGWFASYQAPTGRYAFEPAPRRLIAQLEIEQANGARMVIVTGDGWRTASSPILSSELYAGETYDARLEKAGWDAAGFDDKTWLAAWLAETPKGALVAQVSPAIRAKQVLQPVSIKTLDTGDAVADFGQNFAGWARLRVKGQPGAKIVLRFAEILKANGEADQSNLRAATSTDTYILRGDPSGEVFEPRFTYHGFRYVQISGLVKDWSVEGIVAHSDLPETGLLQIDSPVIQKLWRNTLWSQRSNFFAVPTDCPQRDERLGWTGDAQVFWDTAAYNMDAGAFTRRFMHDLRDAQGKDGAYPMWAPAADYTRSPTPGWADAGVMLPWICYRRYGDTTIVREHWDSMESYVSGVLKNNPDYIWRNERGANFGDWLALDAIAPGDETTPKDLAATAMLKRSLDQMADMAAAIGKPSAAALYRQHAAATAAAFQTAFVKPDGVVGNGSHTSYILALRLDLLTPDQRKAAQERLKAEIRRRGTLLTTGFLGTPLSLDAVADAGDAALVYDLLLRTEFPSWGYMVKKGATTIWERWNGDTGDLSMNSFNHYALGAVCGFLYRRIAGIEELEPGFARVRVKPLLDARVKQGGAIYESVRGRFATAWRRNEPNGFSLDLTIPGNSTAEVHLPATRAAPIRESGRPLSKSPGVRVLARTEQSVILKVGSGEYRFRTG